MPYLAVAVLILDEDGLVGKVDGECHRGSTQTGKRALESVPSREGSGVPPCLTVRVDSISYGSPRASSAGSCAGVRRTPSSMDHLLVSQTLERTSWGRIRRGCSEVPLRRWMGTEPGAHSATRVVKGMAVPS